jgi:hypothetical protein
MEQEVQNLLVKAGLCRDTSKHVIDIERRQRFEENREALHRAMAMYDLVDQTDKWGYPRLPNGLQCFSGLQRIGLSKAMYYSSVCEICKETTGFDELGSGEVHNPHRDQYGTFIKRTHCNLIYDEMQSIKFQKLNWIYSLWREGQFRCPYKPRYEESEVALAAESMLEALRTNLAAFAEMLNDKANEEAVVEVLRGMLRNRDIDEEFVEEFWEMVERRTGRDCGETFRKVLEKFNNEEPDA